MGSLTRDILAETLREIREESGMHEPEERMQSAVGVLTSEERQVWAQWRTVLESDASNAQSLRIIDTALFVLCLDDTTPPRSLVLPLVGFCVGSPRKERMLPLWVFACEEPQVCFYGFY